MELVVVVAVFTTAMVAITDMFLIASRAQRKILGREELASLARASLDQMARSVRQGSIDYARYEPAEGGPLETPDDRLFLRAEDGTTRSYRLSTDACPPDSSPCLLVEEDGVVAVLTPPGASVERFQVVITPATDPDVPAGGPYASDEQPMAWIHLALRSGSGATGAFVRVQSAVTTRRYVR